MLFVYPLPRRDYKVTSQFWHLFFSLASNLGNEVFYCSFFPFWFWNVDTFVARRVIALWALNMYVGQVRLRVQYTCTVHTLYTATFVSKHVLLL